MQIMRLMIKGAVLSFEHRGNGRRERPAHTFGEALLYYGQRRGHKNAHATLR